MREGKTRFMKVTGVENIVVVRMGQKMELCGYFLMNKLSWERTQCIAICNSPIIVQGLVFFRVSLL